MCGIFGVIARDEKTFSAKELTMLFRKLAILSQARGLDSSGVAFRFSDEEGIKLLKGDVPARELLDTSQFGKLMSSALEGFKRGDPFQAMGHARLVTNGTQLNSENNQPVCRENSVVIHNGIIVNDSELWEQHKNIGPREFEVDTEVFAALLDYNRKNGMAIDAAIIDTVARCKGTLSCAVFFRDTPLVALFTNNGSFYYIKDDDYLIFASEWRFLSRLGKKFEGAIMQLSANEGLLLDTGTFTLSHFSASKYSGLHSEPKSAPVAVRIETIKSTRKTDMVMDVASFGKDHTGYEKLLENNADTIRKLQRCTRCILPCTFPFISFDSVGVCNYCRHYRQKNQTNAPEKLKKLLSGKLKRAVVGDCLVPFSGGRDSTYTLHYVVRELGLKPVAFTYDWGMVTDLARRNAARVCGKLGVENIIVAADIHKKRKNISKNIHAWLRKPELGMVPLLMAGDKYFFYHSNRILRENGLSMSIWGSNPLENTDFKSGFTGVPPAFDKKRIDDLAIGGKIKVARYFGKNFLHNSAYFNQSLIDTAGAFFSRYALRREGYLQLFDYIKWDEHAVNDLIMNEYEWETSPDTSSTWRIGDGTAAFYNYIYYTVAGFSEFDTFRSNQIREGQISREAALGLAEKENRPRYENLRWYLSITEVDFREAIRTINRIPKLYQN